MINSISLYLRIVAVNMYIYFGSKTSSLIYRRLRLQRVFATHYVSQSDIEALVPETKIKKSS